ncbi:WD repeat domain phosphoinositide-interacting protein 4 [Lepeophtheirus salmonis]|uniref:WD repeat domain phosphoinositideinteracting protein 4like [Bombus terrestris] n=1 Tax=Lepeophtheirus salmonis TaxID=72036 RepID=A0A0K2U2T5_LEPSM|nr:WD repeat domain phosphoinositide-interacting protein 4-like [Lepeophtheirus salmonis]
MSQSRLGLAEGWGHIRSIRFNQDGSCFVCAFDDGIRVYNTEPVREKAHLKKADTFGSIEIAEILYRTNLIAMVSSSGGVYAENAVMIYDDLQSKMVLEFTFPEGVVNVKLRRDKLIAITPKAIHVFSFPQNPQRLYTLETRDNPRGLCDASPAKAERGIMIFPGYKPGSLQIVDLDTTEQKSSSAPVTLNAHKTELWCLALNTKGNLIATASKKGTLIRIWDSLRRVMLVELRRGSDQADLYCINFSSDDQWLCCSSDKGTVHIFALQDYKLNKRSALSSLGIPGAYAGSQWSLANFTVPQECACVCTFGKQGYIYAVCLDGSFHKYHFCPDGVCNQNAYDVITELCEDCDWENMRR